MNTNLRSALPLGSSKKSQTSILKELRSRWRNAMPRFFARVCWVCSLISGTALAANEAMQIAGIQPHQWWLDVAPYLIGVPAGMAFAAKFSQRYDSNGEPIDKSQNSNLNSQT